MYTDAFISRRAETVFKATKGVLLELSRSYGKHGENRQGASAVDTVIEQNHTLQFVIPPWLARQSTFDLSRDMLRSIYRAT